MTDSNLTKFTVGISLAALLAAALSTLADSAHADILAMPKSSEGYYMCNGAGCQWGEGPMPNPNIRYAPPMDAEGRERDRVWMEECKPTLVRHRYGVMYYHYIKPGCEFGSPE